MGFFSKLRSAIRSVPIVGAPLAAVYGITVAPKSLAEDIIRGKRIDRALVDGFHQQVADIKTLGPYVQTVVSFVPAVGPGVSGALGASIALANGQPLSAVVLEGIKGSIPGGPLAQAAFNATAAIAQGKRLDRVALEALPLPAGQREALATALKATEQLASGKKISDVAVDAALAQLPPNVGKAVTVGLAVGHAAKIQLHGAVAVEKAANVLQGVNSKNPLHKAAALKAVAVTQAKAKQGDKHAAEMLTLLGRHAAAKRVTNRFRVHAKTGIVFREVPAKPSLKQLGKAS